MYYDTPDDWRRARHKRVALFGMSGLGKTYISAMLRDEAEWFHYSVDFRIGTRYMGEHIVDNFKREAMRNPFLRELLRSDSSSSRRTSPSRTSPPSRPISASRGTPRRAAYRSMNTSRASASTARPRSPPPAT